MSPHGITSFPSVGAQVLSSLVHFLGVSILAHCFSRRVAAEQLTSVQGLAQISWARLLIILVFVDSWLFLFTSGIIVFGVGLQIDRAVCTMGIYLCIVFYGTSKVLIYLFLIEKVHIVWAPMTGGLRRRSPIYLLCSATMVGYGAILILLFIGRVAHFRDDGVCIIGLKKVASVPLLAYDLYVNVFLTVLFLWPLARSTVTNPFLKRVALRTLFASIIALTTSAVNILVLTLMHGRQLGWICLGSCGLDVVVNATVLFWVTSGGPSNSIKGLSIEASPARPRMASGAPVLLSVRGASASVRSKGDAPYDGHAYPPTWSPSHVEFALAPPETEPHHGPPPERAGTVRRSFRFFKTTSAEKAERSLQITITRELDTDAYDIESASAHGHVNSTMVQKREGDSPVEGSSEFKLRSLPSRRDS